MSVDPRVLVAIDLGTVTRGLVSDHNPWMKEVPGGVVGQRPFHRSAACIRCIVAGRQSGKTHAAAEEVIKLILERPGSQSCLLMPTYKSTKPTLRHLRRALAAVPGWVWREVDKVFRFANGAELYVRTEDAKGDGVPTRGITMDGVLWVDEASFVSRSSWDAAQDTLNAVRDPRVIVTTTARGRLNSWVFDLANEASEEDMVDFFRFRTTDSPYHDPAWVRRTRKSIGAKRAQEEHDAIFLGDSDTPFQPDDIDRLFATQKIPRRGKQLSLGLDFGKQVKYTVGIIMNEFGESWVVGRWRHAKWQDTLSRVKMLAGDDALCVLDVGAAGGGSVIADFLESELGASRVLRVDTSSIGTKGKVLQQLEVDIEHGRLSIEAEGELAAQCRDELVFFPPPIRRAIHGREVFVYEGVPDGEDAFDDCVISLALANEGRIHGWDGNPSEPVDLRKFVSASQSSGPKGPGVGYRFQLPGR